MKSAAVLAVPTIIPSTVFGQNGQVPPSERVNVGIIGCGNIAKRAHERYIKNPNAQMVAVCDPYKERRLKKRDLTNEAYAKITGKADYNGCVAYSDFREMLSNKDIDAVYVASGDYWHVPMSIMAAKAGKDLHTEKPLGLCINECLQMEKAVSKYDRVFQYGTEGRSMIGSRIGLELVLNGHIGEIQRVYMWAPHGFDGGDFTPGSVPDGFDYDLWLGPAPNAPYSEGRCRAVAKSSHNAIFHYYDYSIGFIAGWGAHPMDLYQWWADNAGLDIPERVKGTGVIPSEGVYNTVTHWDVTYEYKNGPQIRFLDDETARVELPKIDEIEGSEKLKGHGVIFVGEKGQIHVRRGYFNTFPADIRKLGKNPGSKRLHTSLEHESDWIKSILARSRPVSDITSAVRSDIMCHLGDIAIRTGREIKWFSSSKTIVDDDSAKKMMYRSYRNPWEIEV